MKEFNVPREQFGEILSNKLHSVRVESSLPPIPQEEIRLRETVQSEAGEEYTGAWLNVYTTNVYVPYYFGDGKEFIIFFSTSEPSKKNQ